MYLSTGPLWCLLGIDSFQLLAAENLKVFLAILVLTFGSIKLYFAFLVPALWMSLDIVSTILCEVVEG